MKYTIKVTQSNGDTDESPITLEEIDEMSQCESEYLALYVSQLKPGESTRFGGGASPTFDITAH